MSKAVLISIKPEWCEKIINGEKTIEVRKTIPNIKPPFKDYIYCTKGATINDNLWITDLSGYNHLGNGKVIGEFICDTILPMAFYVSDISFFDTEPPLTIPGTCLTDKEIAEYLGIGKKGYGWHISDLKIYDEPKELSEFYKPCQNDVLCAGCKHAFVPDDEDKTLALIACDNKVTRPPQSWCYVEEIY